MQRAKAKKENYWLQIEAKEATKIKQPHQTSKRVHKNSKKHKNNNNNKNKNPNNNHHKYSKYKNKISNNRN